MLACGPSWSFFLFGLWPALIPVAFILCWVLTWVGSDWLVLGIECARDARARRRHARRGFEIVIPNDPHNFNQGVQHATRSS